MKQEQQERKKKSSSGAGQPSLAEVDATRSQAKMRAALPAALRALAP